MKLPLNILAQMRAATRNLMGRGPAAATEAIQQALSAAGLAPQAAATQAPPPQTMRDINPPPPAQARARAEQPQTAAAPETPDAPPTPAQAAQDFAQDFMARLGVPAGLGQHSFDMPSFELPNFHPPGFNAPGTTPAEVPAGAQFIDGVYRNHAGTRSYKLYIPSSYHGQAMPLIVMLHGCTQNPDDFAAGTQMNALAEEKECFVVYPAQTQGANSSRCWNWFNAIDQQRDQGEPSLIAGIARQVIDDYPVNEREVFVAGLSAGGAMAVIVGTLYPDLFAAVGVHSGLPFASAQDLPSALAAMKGGAMPNAQRKAPAGGVPIIVFHGDRDTTVNPRNGDELIAQGVRSQAGGKTAKAASIDGSVPNGHRYTRTTHSQADGSPLGEHWVIHGAGHAWSGGSNNGSYTDGKGPDASREMLRFFKTVS
ncbi:extracellular catalytic domain type 1 short-chain-length polyhydroxyalkanoate depolymerase [Janthinobacterium lividum]|uniref:PHB depolymerase family esterase n=1 Tax=Janthinobacterium lividum TaxID=29581 RepID=A0ABU0XU64_9BURK|nr:PHB depolymerase family esterase [Janthinobacterium lividum]MDQ4627075.1 PHB depolymerase family esterase [Janthinobacterium lividum]MDQ4675302.1 PHB depolymerase family esterase [Janthinobacterium lividum]MDQ4686033.1 PHB depolymerase family esterase [Janthinobacterium lividum]